MDAKSSGTIQECAITTVRPDLSSVVALAQICHFCTTFRGPLKLPSFTRKELEDALVKFGHEDDTHLRLLAELHCKLAREYTNVKMEKLLQDWEKILTRKLSENWSLDFENHPMHDGIYANVPVSTRIDILNALCHWKIQTCGEIRKYIATKESENDIKEMEMIRGTSIGCDDAGTSYWYFGDGCWIYADDIQENEKNSNYIVEYASAKRIRLSINFNCNNKDEMNIPIEKVPMNNVSEEMERLNVSIVDSVPQTFFKKEQKINNEIIHPSKDKNGRLDKDKDVLQSDGPHKMALDVMLCDDKPLSPHDKNPVIKSEKSEKEDLPSHGIQLHSNNSIEELVKLESNGKLSLNISTKSNVKMENPESSILSDGNDIKSTFPLKKKQKVEFCEPKLEETPIIEDVDEKVKGQEVKEDVQETPEDTNITCEMCKKIYNMKYVDPPLSKRPQGDWSCFECLVSNAQGWPRKRSSTMRSSKETQISHSETSTSHRSKKKSKGSTSKSSKSSRKKKSSSSHHKSSSSSKKSKHKKSSSSSSHKKYHHEFSSLLVKYRSRKRERSAIESQRRSSQQGLTILHAAANRKNNWRVVCSSIETLSHLITEKFSGGSIVQERLKGKLISILKTQERIRDEQRKRDEQLIWALPQRQSSRIASTKIKRQSSFMPEDDEDDEEEISRYQVENSWDNATRESSSKDQLANDRESRALRRRGLVNADNNSAATNNDEKKLSIIVCASIVDRMLKEEISDLFSRPVDPEYDGCPTYFDIIKKPMDLGTISEKAKEGRYTSFDMFESDVILVWSNCRLFNPPESAVVAHADKLEQLFFSLRDKYKANNGKLESLDDTDEDGEISQPESISSNNNAWSESSASEDNSGSDSASENDSYPVQNNSRTRQKTAPQTTSKRVVSSATRTRVTKPVQIDDSSDDESSEESDDSDDSMEAVPVPKITQPQRSSRSTNKSENTANGARPPMKRRRTSISDSSSENESSSSSSSSEEDIPLPTKVRSQPSATSITIANSSTDPENVSVNENVIETSSAPTENEPRTSKSTTSHSSSLITAYMSPSSSSSSYFSSSAASDNDDE